MISKEKLPHIISLIDDDSEEIRNLVMEDLSSYGTDLERDLVEFSDILNRNNLLLLKPIIENNRREWLLNNWNNWNAHSSELEKIESAMNLISKFQLGVIQTTSLTTKLNIVAGNFMNMYPYGNELDLSHYLFHILDIRGNTEDYYNPLNSNLYYAIENGTGIPLTLVLIFILIADRVGLNVVGCNFPGHFLAKVDIDDEMLLIDCFNNGRVIFPSDIEDLSEESFNTLLKIINTPISSRTIIKRMLNNLINAYREHGDAKNQELFRNLLVTSSLD